MFGLRSIALTGTAIIEMEEEEEFMYERTSICDEVVLRHPWILTAYPDQVDIRTA